MEPVAISHVSETCAALGNPDRLTLFNLLARNPAGLTIKELLLLADYPPESIQAVRRHMRKLMDVGLVVENDLNKAYMFHVNDHGLQKFIEQLHTLREKI